MISVHKVETTDRFPKRILVLSPRQPFDIKFSDVPATFVVTYNQISGNKVSFSFSVAALKSHVIPRSFVELGVAKISQFQVSSKDLNREFDRAETG